MAIKHLLRREQEVSLRHTLCEGNAAADFLAKKGALSDSSLVILNETPPDMASVLLADAMGVEFVRPQYGFFLAFFIPFLFFPFVTKKRKNKRIKFQL